MFNLAGFLRISAFKAGALLVAGVAAIAVISPVAAARVATMLVRNGFTATRIW